MACLLTAGERELTGGRIFQTEHWVVEHCIGTLGVGTLILKPFVTSTSSCSQRGTLSAPDTRGPGPALQMAMFTEAQALDPHAVRAFCARGRSAFASEPSRS